MTKVKFIKENCLMGIFKKKQPKEKNEIENKVLKENYSI